MNTTDHRTHPFIGRGCKKECFFMSKNIVVEEICYTPVGKQRAELVERKGIGHPDSIADGLAESVSRALCRMYIKEFGKILHHNTDAVSYTHLTLPTN